MIEHRSTCAFVALCIAGIAGCGGTAAPADAGSIDSGPASPIDGGVDCAAAPDGTSCGPQQLCIAHHCQQTACGDGFLDTAGGEQCEDGNAIPRDGCEPVTCQFSCADSTGCNDLDVCTGVEECLADHTCSNPADQSCDDRNPCTADMCDPIAGCRNPLIDADGDGFAWTDLGACTSAATRGGDCNDTDPTVHPGAIDECDPGHVDSDCDGMHDEDGTGHWYADCDGDGFAAASPEVRDSCALPTGGPTACAAGHWTLQAPTGSAIQDCDDNRADVHPGAMEIVGDGVDSSCDGVETCYRDRDDDGYRTDETIESSDTDCVDPGEGAAADPLEWPLSPSSARDICCDQNANVHAGQTTWFNVNNAGPPGNTACPSGRRWDFDCDGVETQRYTSLLVSCFWEPAGCSRGGDTDTAGWFSGAVPACGTPGIVNYATNCHMTDSTSCSLDYALTPQDCH